MVNFKEKLAICYTASGPTYRKTALDKLNERCIDHPNLYYFVITDDKSYFKDVKRANFYVNELKDFYPLYPGVEKYEYFLPVYQDSQAYANDFVSNDYKFPFSSYRFHLLQAREHGIANVAMLCADSTLTLSYLTDYHFSRKNIIWNAMTQWPKTHESMPPIYIENYITREYNLKNNSNYMVMDEACRLYIFQDTDFMLDFFDMWNHIVTTMFKEGEMKHYKGGYVWHDEGMLGALYDVTGIKGGDMCESANGMWSVQHNSKVDRFWASYG